MTTTILVTGGTGFIGANLIRELLKRDKVTVHVLCEPPATPAALWRLATILDQVIVHGIGLTETAKITQLIQSIKPNEIYHLAAYGGSPNQLNQQLIFDVNFTGTVNLLNACKAVGFDVFINTGSSSEYGKRNVPMREDMALEPVSDYAVAKAAATHFCLKEALAHNLPIYTVRPFSVYGDYEIPGRLIPTVLVGSITKQPLNLASPTNVRDYIYIKDMTALYHAVATQKPKSAFIFNGGTGIQSSIADVINTVEQITNCKLAITWGTAASRPWEPTCWRADIALAAQILNWQPTYSLATGLTNARTWFTQHLNFYTERITHAQPAPTTPITQNTANT